LTPELNRDSLGALFSPEESPMAVDIKKLFNEQLPTALSKNAEDAKTIGAKFQMNISGPTGGEWFIDVSATGPSCKEGQGEADCTMSISDEDFQKLVENPQANGMQLFFAGKLKVSGNQMLAMKLQKLFSYQ
jgi:putative sterol carrier protein